jgi:hypothetical protein
MRQDYLYVLFPSKSPRLCDFTDYHDKVVHTKYVKRPSTRCSYRKERKCYLRSQRERWCHIQSLDTEGGEKRMKGWMECVHHRRS